jgi:Putative S-adenosyl-L-methionine-dependent methyltransferase
MKSFCCLPVACAMLPHFFETACHCHVFYCYVFARSSNRYHRKFRSSTLAMRELVRRNIGRRLSEYYAQPANAVVGKSIEAESARLSSLLGEWHWRRVLDRFYREREGHWLTPVELFQPHFSHILGDFCLAAVDASTEGKDHSLEIFELGGGRGTNAKHIMSYLRDKRPEIYNSLTYTLVDSSPSLHRLQKDIFADSEHADRVGFLRLDLMDVAEQK